MRRACLDITSKTFVRFQLTNSRVWSVAASSCVASNPLIAVQQQPLESELIFAKGRLSKHMVRRHSELEALAFSR